MKTLLAFLGGASVVFVFGVLGLSQVCVENPLALALSWFSGIVIGCWTMGMVMFLFAKQVGDLVCKKQFVPPPPAAEFVPPSFSEEEVPIAEENYFEEEEDDNIYEDPDWWKNEQKREQHRRKQDD